MAAISWPEWPGYVKGIEISLLDILALAIYIGQPTKRKPLPFRIALTFYFAAVLFSVFKALEPTAAMFYCWQLVRIFFLYAVVTRGCQDDRVPALILRGMAVGICCEACFAIWERFGSGIIQASGTFGHQNLLGLISHFVAFPTFAILLAGVSDWYVTVVPIVSLIIVILTVSRGAIGVSGLGYLFLYLMSSLRVWTRRKAVIGIVGVLTLLVMAPLAVSSFESRFNTNSPSEYDERVAFEKAASMMLSDYPMGVGANHYTVVVNTKGYNDRAGVVQVVGSNSAHVHNVYYLVAAETGYLGLIALLIVFIRILLVGFVCSWQNRKDIRGDLVLGLSIAILMVCVHSFLEWVFVTFDVQYYFAIVVGLLAGLAQQLGYWDTPSIQHDHNRKLVATGKSRKFKMNAS
jgi:O-antigen ligase